MLAFATTSLMAFATLDAAPACTPAAAAIEVVQAGNTQTIDLRAPFAKAHSVSSAGKDGVAHDYAAIPLREVLEAAKLPLGKALRGKAVGLTVLAQARDGYVASFALAELDAGIGAREVWLAACRDGKPLAEDEGPLRLIVPADQRPARTVRQLDRLRVIAP